MRTPRLAALSLSWLGLSSLAGAQQPSSWAALPVPGGVNPGLVNQLGKLVSYAAGGQLHVFSAFTRDWRSVPHAGGSVRQANDWLLLQEGSTFTAFSSMRGTFEPLVLSPSAFVVNPANQRNDSILVVRDGDVLHTFSGFVGEWVRQQVSPTSRVLVQRHVALVVEDSRLLGLSAFGGAWVATPIAGPVVREHVDGTVAVAEDGATVWGFSAQRQRWSSAASLGPSSQLLGDQDVAVWADATRCLGFSGLRGEFDLVTLGQPAVLSADQQLAAATAGGVAAFFSAPLARWTSLPTAGGPLLTGAATAAVLEANAVHAYSALLGTVATLAVAPAVAQVNWTVVAVEESAGGDAHLYSAFTGQWHAAPPNPVGPSPRTAFNGALLHTGSGFAAFSARTGRTVALAASPAAVPHVDLRSGVLAVEDGNTLHVFEPRRDVWLGQPLGGTGLLSVAIWRASMVATKGQQAWGFGTQHGELEEAVLTGPLLNTRASSESVTLTTPSEILAYSPVPDLVPLAQFPEFRRMYSLGSDLELQLRAPPFSGAAVLLGFASPTPLVLQAGPFLLDPARIGVLWSGPVLQDGREVLRFPIPDAPVLRGLQLAFQGGVLPPAGSAYLTRMSALLLP